MSDEHDDAFVRDLLREAGGAPEPVPDDVRARLDDRLAELVAERTARPAAGGAPGPAAVVPPVSLERARARRRRGLQVLVAAAVVVVGGYTVTTTGLLSGAGGGADSAATSDAGGVAAAPQRAEAEAGTFVIDSRSLQADARALVSSDTTTMSRLARLSAERTARVPAPQLDGGVTADKDDGGLLPGEPASAAAGVGGANRYESDPGAGQPAGSCLDPLVPRDLRRLAVTYDGRAATAVLRPLRRPAADGSPRVRVQIWGCAEPTPLASVVVRR